MRLSLTRSNRRKRSRVRRSKRSANPSILSFIAKGVFDDATLRVMGRAFDAACKELRDAGQSHVVQEVIARRITAAARRGERNEARLRDIALDALRYTRSRR